MQEQIDDKSKFADVPIRVRSWGIITLIFLTALLHPILMSLFVCFLLFQGMREYLTMLHIQPRKIYYILFFLIVPLFYLFFTVNYIAFAYFVPLYAFGVMLLNILSDKEKFQNRNFDILAGFILCGFSIGHLAFIRNLNFPQQKINSINILLLLVVLTELNDVFQYLTGKTFGKNKITPKISPNKTWEGFVGGVISTILLANLLGYFLLPDKGFMLYSIIGLLISTLGFSGDIYISSIKRKAGVKDTSKLIPGHGGLLDRIDSLLFITPIYYWLIYFIYIR